MRDKDSSSRYRDHNTYPYYEDQNGMSMFISRLYPFCADSLGFPATMRKIAKRIEPTAQCEATQQHFSILYMCPGHLARASSLSSCPILICNEFLIVHSYPDLFFQWMSALLVYRSHMAGDRSLLYTDSRGWGCLYQA